MARALPIDERLETLAELVKRARIFYEIWWVYHGADTRPIFIDAMREFSEFFRFDEHAHLTAFIVHAAKLFDETNGVISLPKLIKELEKERSIPVDVTAKAKEMLHNASAVKKLMILRHNAFAHRSASLGYNDAFKKADVTAYELRDLTSTALTITNLLLTARELKEQFFSELPASDVRAMLTLLSARASEAR